MFRLKKKITVIFLRRPILGQVMCEKYFMNNVHNIKYIQLTNLCKTYKKRLNLTIWISFSIYL